MNNGAYSCIARLKYIVRWLILGVNLSCHGDNFIFLINYYVLRYVIEMGKYINKYIIDLLLLVLISISLIL